MHNLKFGDYCIIEQKRYGCENEQFLYKVVGELKSSAWVEVPVKCGEGEQNHGVMQDVYLCICCGIDETKVEKFRKIDCKQNQMFKESPLRKEINELKTQMQEFNEKANIAMINSLKMRAFIFDWQYKFKKLLNKNMVT